MAELNIKITTDYKQTQEAFRSVSDNVKSYQKELAKAQSLEKADQKAMDDYINSMTKKLGSIEATKSGMAKLNAQAKLLKDGIYELNGAWGEGNKVSQHFQAQLKTIEEEMGKLGKTSGGAFTKLLSVAKNILKFQLLMGPITGAIRGFKNTLSDSVKVASEAEQVFNKLATVFANCADAARSAASEISGALGVAGSTAASALSTVGDLLQAQGMGTSDSLATSTEWVKKFQDIIAFKDLNMSLEEFAQNFMSGAAGNLRNFRTFGSIVKESAVNARLAAEGLDKLTGSELELAKMTTRATMALEQQENAMGATKREWESALSVNRRLNEAWKEYKENLGESINKILVPARSWLANILDYTNDVTRALKEIDGGEFTVKVQQETTEDFLKRIAAVMTGVSATNSATGETGNWFTAWLNAMLPAVLAQGGASSAMQMTAAQNVANSKVFSAEQVKEIILATGATNAQIRSAAEMGGFTVTDEVLKEARNLATEFQRATEALRKWNAETESASTNYDNFLESLMGIRGVGTGLSAPTQFNANSHMSFAQQLASEGRLAAIEALNNINSADLSEFVDAISLALGEVDESDMIKGKAESLKSLYTVLFNQFTKDKTLEQNADLLKQIADEYKEITGEIVEVTYAWESVLQGILDATNSSNDSLARMRYQHGLTGTTNENTRSMAYYDAMVKSGSYAQQLMNLGMSASQAESYAKAWYDIQIAIADEEFKYAEEALELEKQKTAELERQKALQDLLNNRMSGNSLISSFQSAISPYQYSGTYASADEWKAGQYEGIRNLQSQLFALGYSANELNAIARILIPQIDAEYEAKKKTIDAENELAATTARIAANLNLLNNRMSGQSKISAFQGAIAPMSYSGMYASADSWKAGQLNGVRNLQQELFALGYSANELNAIASMLIPQINEEYEAKKRLIDEEERQAAILKKQQAWQALGNRALNSTGTLGGVINSFKGDDDIWTKILNAILTILENTEGWSQIAEILNQIFAAFEPVVDALVDLLVSLPWDIIIFCVKVIASVIVVIAKFFEQLFNVFDWLWTNIKAAFHNLGEIIRHPMNKGARDTWSGMSWNELQTKMEATAEKEVEILTRIWGTAWSIDKKMDGNNLDVLRSLYDKEIITKAQFYKGAMVLQSDTDFSPVRASDSSFISSSGPSATTIQYGNVAVTIYSNNPAEVEAAVYRAMEKAGYDTSLAGARLGA